MSKLTVMTPTGDRPIPFGLCLKWMERQTVKPDQWIIVDDGSEPLPELPDYAQVVTRHKRDGEPVHTLPLNIRAGLTHVLHDKLVFMEDDDWYHPEYLAMMSKGLDDYKLFGEANSLYYRVRSRKFAHAMNTTHAALCSTGMTSSVYQWLYWATETDKPLVDLKLWHDYSGHKGLRPPVAMGYRCVGIKELPGRPGLTAGWRGSDHYFTDDPDWQLLEQKIGDDTNVYKPFYKGDA